jgi:hypothetical protein
MFIARAAHPDLPGGKAILAQPSLVRETDKIGDSLKLG